MHFAVKHKNRKKRAEKIIIEESERKSSSLEEQIEQTQENEIMSIKSVVKAAKRKDKHRRESRCSSVNHRVRCSPEVKLYRFEIAFVFLIVIAIGGMCTGGERNGTEKRDLWNVDGFVSTFSSNCDCSLHSTDREKHFMHVIQPKRIIMWNIVCTLPAFPKALYT